MQIVTETHETCKIQRNLLEKLCSTSEDAHAMQIYGPRPQNKENESRSPDLSETVQNVRNQIVLGGVVVKLNPLALVSLIGNVRQGRGVAALISREFANIPKPSR